MDTSIFFPIRDPALLFTVAMGLILAGPLLATRLKVPAITLMIGAGILVGPHGLGLLARDESVLLLGTLGILYIMFVSGLEIDLHLLRKNASHSMVFGLLTFSFPQFLGTAAAAWGLGLALVPAILLASMFASHTLLTYPMVSALGLAKSRAATTCIGGTIVTNMLAMLILAVIASSAKGELDAMFWVHLAMAMAIYSIVVFLLLPRMARWFLRRFADGDIGEFVFVLALLFACSWLAGQAGIEPIIGAFIAGLLLNPLIPERSVLMNRISFFGNAFFIPFFLISVGMLVDLRLLTGARAWTVSLVMIAVALLTKWLAAEVFGRIFRYSGAERMLIYGMSVNQAASTLAAVVIGYKLHLFDEDILTGTIMMILVTCFVGSWVTNRFGRRTALAQQMPENYDFSSAPQRIMIPMANPDNADKLMQMAMLVRHRDCHEPIYPLALLEEGTDLEGRIAQSEKMLGKAVVHAVAAGVPVTPVTRVDMNPASGINQAMRDFRISIGIFGWNGRPAGHHDIFGRTLDAVVGDSRQMLFITRLLYPLSTNRRLVLVLPPRIEYHSGLLQVCLTAKTIASQIGAKIRLDVVNAKTERILPLVNRVGPDVSIASEEFRDWGEWLSALHRNLLPDDLLMMVSVRPGRLAWQPALNRMPTTVAHEFPKNNLIVVYPPLMHDDNLDTMEQQMGLLMPMQGWRIRTDLTGTAVHDAIPLMTREIFPDDAETGKPFTERFRRMAQEAPLELIPGAVLLHIRSRDIADASITVMGVNRHGFDIPKTTTPPQLLLLLVSPMDSDPEIHLRALMNIATILNSPGIVGRISAVDRPDQAAAILADLIQQKMDRTA
jgi:Kef-type K+ transport system membrane component KefB/mannitol/fructose-specific phosphotransferase system IIA component (Ntr-type)